MDTNLVVLLPLDQYRLLLLGSQTDCESPAAAAVHVHSINDIDNYKT
jgi:hypothetical protein